MKKVRAIGVCPARLGKFTGISNRAGNAKGPRDWTKGTRDWENPWNSQSFGERLGKPAGKFGGMLPGDFQRESLRLGGFA